MNTNNEAFAIYNKWSRSLTFHKNGSIPKKGDIYTYTDNDGRLIKKRVTEVYRNIETWIDNDNEGVPWEKYSTKIVSVEVIDIISPIDTSFWFFNFLICKKFKLNKLDTSNVTSMHKMFSMAGYKTKTFNLDLSDWNTSKVEDMNSMFSFSGYKSKTYSIKGLNNWDVSNTTYMSLMFCCAGYFSKTFNLDLNNWDTSKVKNMHLMFNKAGYNATYKLDLSSWNIRKITNYFDFNKNVENKIISPNQTFAIYDETAKSLTFHKDNFIPKNGEIYRYVEDDGNLVKKQVTEVYQNIENLTYDHYKVPWYKHIREIIYVEVVDKISPTITASWFSEFLICEKFKLNKLDISNVTDMSCMFYCAGYNTKTFDLDLNSWNTSKVKDMKYIFWCAGYDATTWNIEGLETWDVSNVINMREMFTHAGYNAKYQLDLSSWDVSNATFYCHFNNGVENKIIAPTWHHNTDY